MYPGSWLALVAGVTLLGAAATVTTGRNKGASGAGQPLFGASNLPARYCRRHLNSMLALSPWRSANFATDIAGSQASIASRRLNSVG